MSVIRFRIKPKPIKSNNGIIAAKYITGQPLDDLRTIARKADSYGTGKRGAAVVTECAFPDETVLIVRWYRYSDTGPGDIEYESVQNGDWLYYSIQYDHLGSDTTERINNWYEVDEK